MAHTLESNRISDDPTWIEIGRQQASEVAILLFHHFFDDVVLLFVRVLGCRMSTSSLDVERIVGEEDRPTNQLYDEGRMSCWWPLPLHLFIFCVGSIIFCVGVSVCTIFYFCLTYRRHDVLEAALIYWAVTRMVGVNDRRGLYLMAVVVALIKFCVGAPFFGRCRVVRRSAEILFRRHKRGGKQWW